VLARAEEQVGGVVERDQLGVRDVPDEVDVRGAERVYEVMQRRQVAFEPALGADDQQPRTRVEDGLVDVKKAESDRRPSCAG
jgi:hypothetical protein